MMKTIKPSVNDTLHMAWASSKADLYDNNQGNQITLIIIDAGALRLDKAMPTVFEYQEPQFVVK